MSELPAGAELDVLVAEKVMGWRRVKNDPKEPFALPFHPSTDISDAWQVIEKLQQLGFTTIVHGGKHSGAYAQFGKAGMASSAPAETAPLAICRAALKAVGVT